MSPRAIGLFGTLHEEREQLGLALRELGDDIEVARLPRVGVERHAARRRQVGLGGGTAHQLRAQPRHQLVERERLDDVVVAAGGETVDAVRHLVLGAEKQDRPVKPFLAQGAAQLVSGAVGQHHVEQDRVRRVIGGMQERVRRRVHPGDGETRSAEAAVEQRADVGIVFYDEDVDLGHEAVANGRLMSIRAPCAGASALRKITVPRCLSTTHRTSARPIP